MPRFVTRRPNHHHHSISKKSDSLIARLAIVPPRVLHRYRRTGKTIAASTKSRPLSLRAAWRFAGSNVIFTSLNVPPFNAWRQLTRLIYHVFKLMLETGIHMV
jgi:hypothetical protein